jgi:hypothetical protein
MTIKCELTMLTFTKTKNTGSPDSVHNAGVTLQSRDIPHTLPSPIFYERAPGSANLTTSPQSTSITFHVYFRNFRVFSG